MTFVRALDTISGQVGDVPEEYLTHPWFGRHLVAVDADQKPYNPNFYQPKTADEYTTIKSDAKMINTPSDDEDEYEEEGSY